MVGVRWWNEKEKGGGIIGAAGVHMIDQLHFITGQKISHINAITETFVKEKRMHPKVVLRGTCIHNKIHNLHLIFGLNFPYIFPGVGLEDARR